MTINLLPIYVLFALSTFTVVQRKENFVNAILCGIFWPLIWTVAITKQILYP